MATSHLHFGLFFSVGSTTYKTEIGLGKQIILFI